MPGEVRELAISDIAATAMESSAYAESNRPNTLPTGLYRLTHRAHAGQENQDGVQWVRFTVEAVRIPKSAEDPFGERRGTLFFSATPRTYRRESGKLDKMTILWGQMARAFDLAAEYATPQAILEAFENYPLQAFVTETLKAPDGGGYANVQYDTDGAYSAETLIKLDAGYLPQNFVQNVGKVKGA